MSATITEKPHSAMERPTVGSHPSVGPRVEETVPNINETLIGRVGTGATAGSGKRKARPARRLRWLVIVVAAALAGVGAWQAYVRIAAHGKAAADAGAAEGESGQRTTKASLGFVPGDHASGKSGAAARYETAPVEVVGRGHMLRLTGSLMPYKRSSVVANTSGIAAEVRVDRGSVVRRNDILVQIDATDANNKLAEGRELLKELEVRLGLDATGGAFQPESQPEVKLAKASLEQARANLRRAGDLYAKHVVTTESYEQLQTDCELAAQRYGQALHQIRQSYQAYKTAQARVKILEKAVADCTIRAPFDGVVVEKLVEDGEQISAGMQATKVVTLAQIDRLRLSLSVPQQNVGDVREGQTVWFHVDSFPDRRFQGEVKFITPAVTSDTRSMIVEAVVENAAKEGGALRPGPLRPGLFATAELEVRQPGEGPEAAAKMFVPASAVKKMDEVARVFVVRDGVAREQVVALGEETPQRVEIRSGLTGKERIVTRPEGIRDGDPVAGREG
jgi:RND family efflux transporter MFP subunit